MKKYWAFFWGTVLVLAAVAVIGVWAKVPGRTLLDVGLGVASLYWLWAITTVPWNLYFRARMVRHEIDASRTRGIEVGADHEAEVRRLERWLLRLAFGGHVVSSVVVAAVTYFSGHVLGYYFAAFYLLSCAIRPAAAYLGYVRVRIAGLLRETTHPRDDVVALTARFATLSGSVKALSGALVSAQERASREVGGVRDELRGASARLREDVRLARDSAERDRDAARERISAVERRVAAVVQHFDSAVGGLSDQAELLNGLRAFLRLVRSETAAE
jgi:hypothetical protein